ncbi:MAG: DNA gyrase subunit A, partial [Clostridia bacterium]|nr:DNA gyrase subunit A [Clostridia bacterium]
QVAKEELMTRFSLSDRQAQAILDMRLARLTGLERERLQEEYAELEKTIAYLRAVLADEKMVLNIIREEILAIRDNYADERRTSCSAMDGEIDPEDLIQEEKIVITFTHMGYIKRIGTDAYRSQRRGGKGITALTAKEEDFAEHVLACSTHDEILFFTNRGRVYKLKGYEIPEAGRTAKGTAVVNILQLDGGEKVTAMIPLPRDHEGYTLVMATRQGKIKRCALSDFDNLRKMGLIAINLEENDEMAGIELTRGGDQLMIATRNGMAIRFDEEDVRIMGRQAMGVRSMRIAEGDELISLDKIRESATVLTITENGFGKRTEIDRFREQSRAGKGIKAMNITDETGPLVSMMVLPSGLDLMLITNEGTIIRIPVDSISVVGRVTKGVRLMRLAEGSKIVSVTATEQEPEEPELTEDSVPDEPVQNPDEDADDRENSPDAVVHVEDESANDEL